MRALPIVLLIVLFVAGTLPFHQALAQRAHRPVTSAARELPDARPQVPPTQEQGIGDAPRMLAGLVVRADRPAPPILLPIRPVEVLPRSYAPGETRTPSSRPDPAMRLPVAALPSVARASVARVSLAQAPARTQVPVSSTAVSLPSVSALLSSTATMGRLARASQLDLYTPPPRLYKPGTPPQERLWAASLRYRRTGTAETLVEGRTVVFPYGKNQPTVKTSVLHFTLLELAPNEYVNGQVIIGGPPIWDTITAVTGTEEDFTQVVSVKPLQCGTRTNLAIPTNAGRLYQLELVSADCDEASGELPGPDDYTRHVRWWYPDGSVSSRSGEGMARRVPRPNFDELARQKREAFSENSLSETPPASSPEPSDSSPDAAGLSTDKPRTDARFPSLDLRAANTDFDVDIDRRFPCAPTMVADDGERMFIRFDEDAPLCRTRFPVFEKGEGRRPQLLNYQVFDGNLYVVEGTPVESFLMYRTESGRERRVEITNLRLKRALNNRRR